MQHFQTTLEMPKSRSLHRSTRLSSWLLTHYGGTLSLFLTTSALRSLQELQANGIPSDFVYGDPSGFKFTQKLIRDGSAIPYTAHASSPTITMPRVKAITTGSVPSFLDVILNFAESDTSSNLGSQDTWLWQLKNKTGGNLVMYGDDTWLKLFPDMFLRADGTTSFFVSVSGYICPCKYGVLVDSNAKSFSSGRISLRSTIM